MNHSNKISLYWKCQLAGWSAASLYWGYAAYARGGFDLQLGIADFLLDVFIGVTLTDIYRRFAKSRGWKQLDLRQLVFRIAPAILLLACVFMVLIIGKLYLVREYIFIRPVPAFRDFFRENWLIVIMTGTRLMSIWVLAYHLYHYAQREINIAKENGRLQLIAKEAQLNNLSSQLNPHFFFNSLNNIKFLVRENPDAARRAIDLLSDLLRNSLYGKSDRLVLVKEEVELVKDYLELEKLRFEHRLQTNISIGESASKMMIPPLSIQSLIENAIKHGVEKTIHGGEVGLRVNQSNGFLEIQVENAGKLEQVQGSHGLGLKNLRERLELQYNGRAMFDLVTIPGNKVLATIKIPVE